MTTIMPTPITTWQYFGAIKRIFTSAYLYKVFGRSGKQRSRWCCDPSISMESQNNPMDRYETILNKLMELSKFDLAMGAVDRQARIVGSKNSSSYG